MLLVRKADNAVQVKDNSLISHNPVLFPNQRIQHKGIPGVKFGSAAALIGTLVPAVYSPPLSSSVPLLTSMTGSSVVSTSVEVSRLLVNNPSPVTEAANDENGVKLA